MLSYVTVWVGQFTAHRVTQPFYRLHFGRRNFSVIWVADFVLSHCKDYELAHREVRGFLACLSFNAYIIYKYQPAHTHTHTHPKMCTYLPPANVTLFESSKSNWRFRETMCIVYQTFTRTAYVGRTRDLLLWLDNCPIVFPLFLLFAVTIGLLRITHYKMVNTSGESCLWSTISCLLFRHLG